MTIIRFNFNIVNCDVIENLHLNLRNHNIKYKTSQIKWIIELENIEDASFLMLKYDCEILTRDRLLSDITFMDIQ
jgi:hypothetical protein